MRGEWKDGVLEVERTGWGDSKITETFALEDSSRSLVIHTKMEPKSSTAPREFKRVYRKVTES